MRSLSRRVLTTAAIAASLLVAGVTGAAAHETYTVQSGDTLASIARAHDGAASWQQLAERNDLADPDYLLPGQVLAITGGATPDGETGEASPEPAASEAAGTQSADAGVWDRLAQCESGGNWSINTGNGFYGGLQFTRSSWEAVGGTGLPHHASKQEQIARAEALLERQGWGAWPACSAELGLR